MSHVRDCHIREKPTNWLGSGDQDYLKGEEQKGIVVFQMGRVFHSVSPSVVALN